MAREIKSYLEELKVTLQNVTSIYNLESYEKGFNDSITHKNILNNMNLSNMVDNSVEQVQHLLKTTESHLDSTKYYLSDDLSNRLTQKISELKRQLDLSKKHNDSV